MGLTLVSVTCQQWPCLFSSCCACPLYAVPLQSAGMRLPACLVCLRLSASGVGCADAQLNTTGDLSGMRVPSCSRAVSCLQPSLSCLDQQQCSVPGQLQPWDPNTTVPLLGQRQMSAVAISIQGQCHGPCDIHQSQCSQKMRPANPAIPAQQATVISSAPQHDMGIPQEHVQSSAADVRGKWPATHDSTLLTAASPATWASPRNESSIYHRVAAATWKTPQNVQSCTPCKWKEQPTVTSLPPILRSLQGNQCAT